MTVQISYYRRPDWSEVYMIREGAGSQIAQMLLHGLWAKVGVGHPWCPMEMLAPRHVRDAYQDGDLIEIEDSEGHQQRFDGLTFVMVAVADRAKVSADSYSVWKAVEGKLVSYVVHEATQHRFIQVSDMLNSFAKPNDERFGSPGVRPAQRRILRDLTLAPHVPCYVGSLGTEKWRSEVSDILRGPDADRLRNLNSAIDSIQFVPTREDALDNFAERMRKLRGLG